MAQQLRVQAAPPADPDLTPASTWWPETILNSNPRDLASLGIRCVRGTKTYMQKKHTHKNDNKISTQKKKTGWDHHPLCFLIVDTVQTATSAPTTTPSHHEPQCIVLSSLNLTLPGTPDTLSQLQENETLNLKSKFWRTHISEEIASKTITIKNHDSGETTLKKNPGQVRS